MATRKLEIPTKTGILRRKRNGANIGSGAMKISTKTNRIENIAAIITEIITAGLDHCGRDESENRELFYLQGTHRLACVVARAKEHKRRTNLTDQCQIGNSEIENEKKKYLLPSKDFRFQGNRFV